MSRLNENTLTEQPVIDWFKQLGYEYKFGPDISPGGLISERKSHKEVVLIGRLRSALIRINPDLSEEGIDKAIKKLIFLSHPNLEVVNKEIYRMLVEGIRVEVKDSLGNRKGKIVRVFDFENPLNNEFLVVNQFTVQGPEGVRRPDVVVFINGIPIAIFELKNPEREEATIQTAYQQLQDYKKDIPDIFKYNQILVISDLQQARYGTISSSFEWFKVWREEENVRWLKNASELEILIKGIFSKDRIIDIIENFIVFEADSESNVAKYTKKIALHHQYFGVNKAVSSTIRAVQSKSKIKKRIGVLWHAQGSGKTISMVFYVNKVKKVLELNSPTIVFLTDRNDLDNQFYKTFLRCGYSKISKQAGSIKDLKDKLKTAGAELIFTTIQKFAGENFEVLSERHNIIVIADEAHRSQYAKLAANARKALPNASFMGITATPISLIDRNTRLVFGDYIHIYRMSDAIKDGATVPIYYEPRLVTLHLTSKWIDGDFDVLNAEVGVKPKELRELETLVLGSPNRLMTIAEDIVKHFNQRGLEGKAMVVTMSRKVAVEMYKLISKIKDAPETAVVISNPQEFKNEIQKEINISEIERRFKDPDDTLKMVVVCDMWLTGFDVPALHTMYFDKPLKNHTLFQAIARVNRVFRDKPGGLIVDYIGIADDLKKSLSIYEGRIIDEALKPIEEIINKMLEKYDVVKSYFVGIDYSNWKYLKGEKLATLFQEAINAVITNPKTGLIDEKRQNNFLKESLALLKLFAFAMPHEEAYKIKDEIEFFKAVRNSISKRISFSDYVTSEPSVDSVIKSLVPKIVVARGVLDIFELREKGKPDISIFDERFLKEIKDMRYKNVAIKILEELLRNEIKARVKKNSIRFKPLLKILESIIEKYENRILNSSDVIDRLIELAKEIKMKEQEGVDLGLTDEELAFYDVIAKKGKLSMRENEIRVLVKELVKAISKDLTIDWSYNEVIKSRIKSNIKLLLAKRNIPPKNIETMSQLLFNQAKSLFSNYNQFTYN